MGKLTNKETRIISVALASWGLILTGSGYAMNDMTKPKPVVKNDLEIVHKRVAEVKSNEIKLKDIELEVNKTLSVDVKDYLENVDEIDAEILKVGHHGSNTSTSDFFLESVSPDYALISAELGNSYKHPNKTTMEKLQESNVEVYRTDENGTVIATITSDDVSFNCEPGDYLSGTELKEREKQW